MQRLKRFSSVRCLLLSLAVAAAASIAPVVPWAQAQSQNRQETVHVIGSSRIHANELATARDEAVKTGLIEAVSRVLSTKAGAQMIMGNLQVLNERIFSRTDQFIDGYRVMAESNDGRTYLVMVQAAVASGRLQEELESLGIRAAQPGAPVDRNMVEIVVAGTGGNIANFVKLRGALSAMSGVEDVLLKEMRQDEALLRVGYLGSARALANALQQQQFDSFGIKISQIESNTINMQLIRR
jgi:hypothetical protein